MIEGPARFTQSHTLVHTTELCRVASDSSALSASLLLRNPGAYSGRVMCGGCFAVEDGDQLNNGLLDKPVLFCRGQFDDVIPRHKFEQAEAYLSGPSGEI